MPIPENQKLYNQVKEDSKKIYKKSSAYRSGYIVKEYLRRGGTYKNDGKEHALNRWFREKWHDIGHLDYPVYRPQIKINEHTPLLESEIDKKDLQNKIKEKQIIRGYKNLIPFKEKKI